jgi:hypothetical protein
VKKQSWQDWVQFIGVLAALLLRCNAIFRSQCIFDVFWAQRCTGQGGEFQYCAQQQPSPAIALLHEALLIVAMVRWFAANGSELRPDVAALAIWVVAYCRSDGC